MINVLVKGVTMASTSHASSEMDGNVLLMPGIFNDTLRLLLEAHEYFHHYGQEDQQNITGRERTIYSCEMSRITMRLSSVMAWLMVRKAVFAGKIPPEDAVQKYRLDSRDVCLFHNAEAESILPTYMSYLLEESLELYSRISRLEDMALLSEQRLN